MIQWQWYLDVFKALLQYTCKKSYSPTNPSAIYVLTLKTYLTKCELELLFGDRAFAKAAPELWNSLLQSLRDITSLDQFKSRLKTFLFLND